MASNGPKKRAKRKKFPPVDKPFGAGTLVREGIRAAGQAIMREAPQKVGVSAAAAAKALARRKAKLRE